LIKYTKNWITWPFYLPDHQLVTSATTVSSDSVILYFYRISICLLFRYLFPTLLVPSFAWTTDQKRTLLNCVHVGGVGATNSLRRMRVWGGTQRRPSSRAPTPDKDQRWCGWSKNNCFAERLRNRTISVGEKVLEDDDRKFGIKNSPSFLSSIEDKRRLVTVIAKAEVGLCTWRREQRFLKPFLSPFGHFKILRFRFSLASCCHLINYFFKILLRLFDYFWSYFNFVPVFLKKF